MIVESKNQPWNKINGAQERYQIQKATLVLALQEAVVTGCDHTGMREALKAAAENPVWCGNHITCMKCDTSIYLASEMGKPE